MAYTATSRIVVEVLHFVWLPAFTQHISNLKTNAHTKSQFKTRCMEVSNTHTIFGIKQLVYKCTLLHPILIGHNENTNDSNHLYVIQIFGSTFFETINENIVIFPKLVNHLLGQRFSDAILIRNLRIKTN